MLVTRDAAAGGTLIYRLGRLLALLSVTTGALEAQAVCQSAMVAARAGDIDLAPPAGYVEICSKDVELCRLLTNGYPPSVTTLAYFVSGPEWQAYRQSPPRGFTRYLIPQLARSMSSADLRGFKQYLHAQQGSIPDHTKLPSVFESEGRVPLGIFDEKDSSISFGTIMKLRQRFTGSDEASVATNTMVVVKGSVLSLYVYREFGTAADVDSTEQLTKDWLTCLHRANRGVKSPDDR